VNIRIKQMLVATVHCMSVERGIVFMHPLLDNIWNSSDMPYFYLHLLAQTFS
jgi:hypothetical protein